MPRAHRKTLRFDADLELCREAIADLLDGAADGVDEVEDILAGLEPRALANALVEVVRGGAVSPLQDALLAAIGECADRRTLVPELTAVVVDPQATDATRALALAVLMPLDEARTEALAARLPPEVMHGVAERSARAMVMQVEVAPEASAEIAAALIGPGPEEQRWLVETQARVCAALGTSPGVLYRDVLGHRALGSIQEAVEALIDGAPDAEGVAAYAAAADGARGAARKRYTARADALRKALADDPPPRPEARAWATRCDGAGGWLVHLDVRRPEGSWLCGQVCLRARGELLSAWVDPAPADGEPARVREAMRQSMGRWVEIPVGAAAALVVEAGARGCPPEAEAGLALARRVHRAGDAPPAAVEPADGVTRADLDRLLAGPLAVSWFLDDEDAEAAGLPPLTGSGRGVARWRDAARAAMVEAGLHRRYGPMAEQVAWWLALAGDAEGAGRLAAAARGACDDPATSPLIDFVLDETVSGFERGPDEVQLPLDDLFGEQQSRESMWPSVPDGVRYDGRVGPDRATWLALDEGTRLTAVRRWLESPEGPRLPDDPLNAPLLCVIENQLCADDPVGIRAAFARLRGDGLDRFGAVLALQSLLAVHMMSGVTPDTADHYAADVAAVARDGIAAVFVRVDGGGRSGRRRTVKRARKAKGSGGSKAARKKKRKRR